LDGYRIERINENGRKKARCNQLKLQVLVWVTLETGKSWGALKKRETVATTTKRRDVDDIETKAPGKKLLQGNNKTEKEEEG